MRSLITILYIIILIIELGQSRFSNGKRAAKLALLMSTLFTMNKIISDRSANSIELYKMASNMPTSSISHLIPKHLPTANKYNELH